MLDQQSPTITLEQAEQMAQQAAEKVRQEEANRNAKIVAVCEAVSNFCDALIKYEQDRKAALYQRRLQQYYRQRATVTRPQSQRKQHWFDRACDRVIDLFDFSGSSSR